jgi:outer membrane protein assembly factor BamB
LSVLGRSLQQGVSDLKNFSDLLRAISAIAVVSLAGLIAPVICKTEDKVDLQRCFSLPLRFPAAGIHASDGVHYYVGSTDGTLYAINSSSGEIAWRTELGGAFISSLLPVDGGLVAVTAPRPGDDPGRSSGAKIQHISAGSGVASWSAKLPASESYHLGKLNGSILAVSLEGVITTIKADSGALTGSTIPFGSLSSTPAFATDTVIIGTRDRMVRIIHSDGRVVERRTEHVPTAVRLLGRDRFAVGDQRGSLSYFALDGGQSSWSFKSGGAVSWIEETPEGVLITSLDNFVYLLSDYNGNVIWKRRLTGRVVEGGLLTERALLVIPVGDNTVFAIDRLNGKILDTQEFPNTDIVGRVPVQLNATTFAVATQESVDSIGFAGCSK